MHGWLVLGALLLGACAATPPAKQTAALPAATSPRTPRVAPEAWLTKLDRDNALVGRVWDVKGNTFVDPQALLVRLGQARFVLVGERHDNPDHHRLQARVVDALARTGRAPAVVFEMLDISQQGLLEQYRASPGASAVGLGTALGWERTSWPPFREYEPIFAVAFARQLPIGAGNLPQVDAKALVKQGISALSNERVKELRLDEPFPAALEASLLDELRASHCGQLPESLLGPMALAQHARDAQMAKVLLAVGAKDGAVLIAGGGHARLDRGVPYHLARATPGVSVTSLVLREVRHDDTDAKAYVAEEGPFDFVWFTPRASDDDPCAAFHAK
jgi:uncharacterized iron-regulated protein